MARIYNSSWCYLVIAMAPHPVHVYPGATQSALAAGTPDTTIKPHLYDGTARCQIYLTHINVSLSHVLWPVEWVSCRESSPRPCLLLDITTWSPHIMGLTWLSAVARKKFLFYWTKRKNNWPYGIIYPSVFTWEANVYCCIPDILRSRFIPWLWLPYMQWVVFSRRKRAAINDGLHNILLPFHFISQVIDYFYQAI